MRKNLHSFSPGSSAMMFGLRVHSSDNESRKGEHRAQIVANPSEQLEKTPARLKISWRPKLNLRLRFAQR